MFKTLEAGTLKRMMDRHEDFVLINVLGEDAFEKEHIPGSDNVPVDSPDFVTEVESLAGDKSRRIVVYCASKTCQASPTAARKLDETGFTHVLDFEGGMADWHRAGFEVVSFAPAGRF
jgi:rhodanese-related sulfurtransferase